MARRGSVIRRRYGRMLAAMLAALTLVGLAGGLDRPAKAVSTGPALVDYTITTQTGQPIAPGTTDIGNHCDDCTTQVTFPFPVSLYSETFTTALASSNGNLQFGSDDSAYTNGCLPSNVFASAVVPYWDDLSTVSSGFGIFSATTGSPPNRQFVLEWRAQHLPGPGNANFEAIFDESSGVIRLRYGAGSNNGATATVGLQESANHANQFSCDTRAAHCSLGRVRRTRSRRVGRVLSQTPRAGVVRARGTKISLVVGRR